MSCMWITSLIGMHNEERDEHQRDRVPRAGFVRDQRHLFRRGAVKTEKERPGGHDKYLTTIPCVPVLLSLPTATLALREHRPNARRYSLHRDLANELAEGGLPSKYREQKEPDRRDYKPDSQGNEHVHN